MDTGYIMIDGHHLCASINEVYKIRPQLRSKKLDITLLTNALVELWLENIDQATRVNFYFKKGDDRIHSVINISDSRKPGYKDHWKIIECCISIKEGVPDLELEKLSSKYRDIFPKREKGVDIKLACDALLAVANNRVQNIVFLVNDRDYIPLFEAIEEQGGNAYLTALDSKQKIAKDLTDLADKFLTLDS
ncbi:MAG: NYN domain-containing protein [Patescibacteria group bacterium]